MCVYIYIYIYIHSSLRGRWPKGVSRGEGMEAKVRPPHP